MKKSTRICKTCGKEYEYCHTHSTNKFRWQDVACSPECGTKYFAAILAARGEDASVLNAEAEPQEVEVENIIEVEEEPEADAEEETPTVQTEEVEDKPWLRRFNTKLDNN